MQRIEDAIRSIQTGREAEGLSQLDQLVKASSTRLEALGHRAWLHRSLGHYELAIADYQTILAEQPLNHLAAAHWVETILLTGDAEKALYEAISLLQRDPSSGLAAQVIVRAQEALGMQTTNSAYPYQSRETFAGANASNQVIQLLEQETGHFKASIPPEVGRLIYDMVRLIRPRVAIETGCFIGYSSLWIAQALEDNQFGHLHAFDLFLPQPDYVSPVLGKCPETLSAVRGHLEHAGLSHRVTCHKGDSSSNILGTLGQQGQMCEFVFIDGDHRIRGCMKDWSSVDRLLVEGGLVLLHDTTASRAQWLGPRYLLEKLGSEVSNNYHWIDLPMGAGLGLIQKRTIGCAPQWWPSAWEILTELLFNRRSGWHQRK